MIKKFYSLITIYLEEKIIIESYYTTDKGDDCCIINHKSHYHFAKRLMSTVVTTATVHGINISCSSSIRKNHFIGSLLS